MKDGIIPSLHDNLESYVECVKERWRKLKETFKYVVRIS